MEENIKLDRKIKEIMHNRASYLDALIASVLRENGCKATDLELIEQYSGSEIRWFVRKKKSE